ncbi:MAG TPA: CoA pyrophosphatase [Solirubrobacteraceae bacterium]|nr:CoA pyrophosphatase [Solirubrobacteraceae bacterium]
MDLARALGELLLDAEAHASATPDEQVAAAVLVPLYVDQRDRLRLVLTKRRSDLRRHAGEVSFPGGRQDEQDSSLQDTALREAQEEIGLARTGVSIVGALERTSTFATNYSIHPFVALLDGEPGPRAWRISEREVESVLEPTLDEVRAAHGRTTVERRGFVFETDAYLFDDQVVWGATARIVEELLSRIAPLLDRGAYV